MRFSTLFACATLLAPLATGCTPDLGTCDDALAHTVVYDQGNFPYYAGQAQLNASCELCHATGIGDAMAGSIGPFPSRHGAPHDLDWDVQLANGTAADTDRLRAGQLLSFRFRGDIWGQVSGGQMPPRLSATATMAATDPAERVSDYYYAHPDGTPAASLESLRTPEGRAIFRNWLACGLPVVERTTRDQDARPASEMPIGDILSCNLGICGVQPTWHSIYSGFIRPTCAVGGCHADAGHISGMTLSPTDEGAALIALVGQPSTSPACGAPAVRVVPGHPESSLLLAKLIGHYDGMPTNMVCGPIMPFGSTVPIPDTDTGVVSPIRDWIAAGANP